MKTKVSILLLMLFSAIAASALPHVNTPYKLKRTNPQTRPFEPGAPTDDIVVAMDEEALLVLFLEGQDSANRKHNWVCDGGERIIVTQKLALAGGGYEEVELSRKTYFRFNWGWCGSENGYFLAGVFNSDMISTTDVRGTYGQNVRYFSVQK